MRVILAVLAIVSVSSALPAESPCVCTMDWTPVCGVDGKTYSNKCAADCVNVAVASNGACASTSDEAEATPCICTMEYAPVCGVDGVTYGNKCGAKCANVAVASNGVCASTSDVIPAVKNEAEATPCICTMEYAPVCGVDGVTYGNKCGAACANVAVSYTGECHNDGVPAARIEAEAPLMCMCYTMPYAPVCGVDGITYRNKCGADCANVAVASNGECSSDAICICPRNYEPMCGQDGHTYSNQCEMNCAGVAMFQVGQCTAVPSAPIVKRQDMCVCTFMYMPVCGSDGVSYGNECNLKCVANLGVTKVSDGPC